MIPSTLVICCKAGAADLFISKQGYQMAKNLQSKLKPSDKVSIFDINPESMKGLETEMKAASNGATVELAASAFDASKDAVSHSCPSLCVCGPSIQALK